ncbi:MAG: ankyrin repeat domain-containing protein [Fimbriimonas sp.]
MIRRGLALGVGFVIAGGLVGAAYVARAQSGRAMDELPRGSGEMIEAQMRPDPDTPLNRKLAAATAEGDLAEVRELLRQGASADARVTTDAPPEWQQTQEWTPMPLLAMRSSPEELPKFGPVFRLLIESAKDVDAQDTRTGMTLLMAAADMEDLDSVRSLLARKAQVNKPSSKIWNGATALTMAIMARGESDKRLTPVIQALLDAGADVNVRHRNDPMGNPLYVEANAKAPKDAGTTPLMMAAQYGKVEVVRELLHRGADATVRDILGHDALWFATRRRHDAVVAILRNSAPLDLHQAARVGTEAQVRELLSRKPDVNARDAQGETPLLMAALREDHEVAEALVAAGADVNARSQQDEFPLSRAAERGNMPLLRLLLGRGADPMAKVKRTQEGFDLTPLQLAVVHAQAEAVAELLKRNHDQAELDRAFLLAVKKAGGMPARPREAARILRKDDEILHSWNRIIDALLKAGANVRAGEDRALFVAAFDGKSGLVRLLLDRGANPNVRGQKGEGLEEGMSALMAAVSRIGMDEGVEARIRDGSMMGPEPGAYAASANEATATAKLLLARGADIDQPDERGRTPLHRTIEFDMPAMTEFLLKHRPKVDKADADGQTPLMNSAADGNLKIVRMLLAHRAQVNARDRAGRTALMLAIDDGRNEEYRRHRAEMDDPMRGHGQGPRSIDPADLPNPDGRPEVVRVLLRHGADRRARSLDRQTAESLARKNGFAKVLAMLAER